MKLVALLIMAGVSSSVGGQSCTAPGGSEGSCIPIKSCPSLSALTAKETRTQEETDLLRQAACGFDGSTPKVCCDQSCFTPDGFVGRCTDIHDCVHLAKLIKGTLTNEVVTYLRKSRCTGPTQYSVCCGPETDIVGRIDCTKQSFVNPPDPRTECCGVDSNTDIIYAGGETAKIDEFPWLALIEYEGRDGKLKLLCAGSLISSKYVLTAAHCVAGPVKDIGTPKNIRLGEFDTTNEGKDCVSLFQEAELDCNDPLVTIPIESINVHPEYDRNTRANNIALIRMKDNAPFTDFIRPICLPATDVTVNPPAHSKFTAAGWGAFNDTILKSARKLRVTLPLVDKQKCQAAFSTDRRRANITDRHLCAGGKTAMDSCKGDSGGPLMYVGLKVELIGVVSYGTKPCGLNNIPGVYTKVFEYKDWIYNNIKV